MNEDLAPPIEARIKGRRAKGCFAFVLNTFTEQGLSDNIPTIKQPVKPTLKGAMGRRAATLHTVPFSPTWGGAQIDIELDDSFTSGLSLVLKF